MRFPWQKKESDKQFPPVPDWKPEFRPDNEDLIDRFSYYLDGNRDFVILKHGTLVLLETGLDNESAQQYASEVISEIYNYHPDMNPQTMDDGNVLVSYNHLAFNIVIEEHAQQHWKEIDRNHQQAICTDEVLITSLGNNVFDDFGKRALYGRCFFFMDAETMKSITGSTQNYESTN